MKELKVIDSLRLKGTEAYFPSDTIYSGALSSYTEQEVTVPPGADFVHLNYTDDIYVNYDTTATVPSGSVSEGGGELNPVVRYIGETTVMHLIAPRNCVVTLCFYSKNEVSV